MARSSCAAPSTITEVTGLTATIWFYGDMIEGLIMAVMQLERLPFRRKTWLEPESISLPPQPQQELYYEAVHPAGSAHVPCPAAPAGVRQTRVDVCGHDIGLLQGTKVFLAIGLFYR
jgi:hypothetical protein